MSVPSNTPKVPISRSTTWGRAHPMFTAATFSAIDSRRRAASSPQARRRTNVNANGDRDAKVDAGTLNEGSIVGVDAEQNHKAVADSTIEAEPDSVVRAVAKSDLPDAGSSSSPTDAAGSCHSMFGPFSEEAVDTKPSVLSITLSDSARLNTPGTASVPDTRDGPGHSRALPSLTSSDVRVYAQPLVTDETHKTQDKPAPIVALDRPLRRNTSGSAESHARALKPRFPPSRARTMALRTSFEAAVPSSERLSRIMLALEHETANPSPSQDDPAQAPELSAPVQIPDASASAQHPDLFALVRTPDLSALSQTPDVAAPIQSPDSTPPTQTPDVEAPIQNPDSTTPTQTQTPDVAALIQSPDSTFPIHTPDVEAPIQNPDSTNPTQTQTPDVAAPIQNPGSAAPTQSQDVVAVDVKAPHLSPLFDLKAADTETPVVDALDANVPESKSPYLAHLLMNGPNVEASEIPDLRLPTRVSLPTAVSTEPSSSRSSSSAVVALDTEPSEGGVPGVDVPAVSSPCVPGFGVPNVLSPAVSDTSSTSSTPSKPVRRLTEKASPKAETSVVDSDPGVQGGGFDPPIDECSNSNCKIGKSVSQSDSPDDEPLEHPFKNSDTGAYQSVAEPTARNPSAAPKPAIGSSPWSSISKTPPGTSIPRATYSPSATAASSNFDAKKDGVGHPSSQGPESDVEAFVEANSTSAAGPSATAYRRKTMTPPKIRIQRATGSSSGTSTPFINEPDPYQTAEVSKPALPARKASARSIRSTVSTQTEEDAGCLPKLTRRHLYLRKARNVAIKQVILNAALGRQLGGQIKPILGRLANGERLNVEIKADTETSTDATPRARISPGRIAID